MKKSNFLILGGLVAVFFVLIAVFSGTKKNPSYATHERDLVIRTLWAEAGTESRQGKIFALWVMRNRVGCYGWSNLSKVVKAKNQFEPWVYKKTRDKMAAFSKNYLDHKRQIESDPRRIRVSFKKFRKQRRDYQTYRKLARLYDLVMKTPQKDDPTNDAFYFENRAITKKRGRKSLCFGRKVTVIGHHSFCQAEKLVKRKKCKLKYSKRGV